MNELLLLGVVFFLIGIATLGGGVVSLVSANRRRTEWRAADGTVVKLVYTTRSMQAPVVAFSSPRGPVQFQSNVSSSPPAWQVGEPVKVLFDPNDPSQAVIDSFAGRWLVPLLLGLFGGVFAFIGFVMAVFGLLSHE